MKLLYSQILLAAAALSSPVPTSLESYDNNLDLPEGLEQSVNEPYAVSQVLEKRIDINQCKQIGRFIVEKGNSVAIASAVYGSLDLVSDICEYYDDPDCAQILKWTKRGLTFLVFPALSYMHGAIGTGPNGLEQNTVDGSVRRSTDPDSDFTDNIYQLLEQNGLTIEGLESVDVSGLNLEKRGSEPRLAHRYLMRRLCDGQGGQDSDVTIDHYENDQVSAQFNHASDKGNSTETDLQKRYDDYGVKISWTSRGVIPLGNDDREAMADAIARDWYDWADYYHMQNSDIGMSDYFGLVKTDDKANAYFRITAQVDGYGLDYEDVNACGGMGHFVDDA